jgi:hypothetical protein
MLFKRVKDSRSPNSPCDLSFAHAALVTEWPRAIHVMDRARGVQEVDIARLLSRWSIEVKFFDVWLKQAQVQVA